MLASRLVGLCARGCKELLDPLRGIVRADVRIVLDGIVYAPDAPPGESDWEYGGALMLMVLIVAAIWGGFSIRKTESTFKAEQKRKAETKTLAELMSINMGA